MQPIPSLAELCSSAVLLRAGMLMTLHGWLPSLVWGVCPQLPRGAASSAPAPRPLLHCNERPACSHICLLARGLWHESVSPDASESVSLHPGPASRSKVATLPSSLPLCALRPSQHSPSPWVGESRSTTWRAGPLSSVGGLDCGGASSVGSPACSGEQRC
jgi:hypothetical protein